MSKENSKKKRLDILMHQAGLAESRSKAQAIIMSGVVYVDDVRIDKPGTAVRADSKILIKKDSTEFVSRGGKKLQAAIEHFNIDLNGFVALDIGASTGGFTDCMLKYGAEKVYAFDVGHGQIDWGIRNDNRVVVREKINCRYLKPEDLDELVDIVAIDVSFISLGLIIGPASTVLKSGGGLIALIKPQFEVGKGEVGKGGIVTDEEKHKEVILKIENILSKTGFKVSGVIPSPIKGSEGNSEFLIYAIKI